VITAIDGQPIRDFEDLVAYLARQTTVGQTVTLTVLRDNKETTIDLTLAARPKEEAQQNDTETAHSSRTWLGIDGVTLTPEIAQAMGLDSDQTGLLIEQVIQDSPAHAAGLQGSYKAFVASEGRILIGGDVITAMDGQTVDNAYDLALLMQQTEVGQTVNMTLLRDSKQIEVPVTLTERPSS
jgi:2-alkenal reductase